MSASTTLVKGTHKTGFAEQKAYNMLDERMDKFAKLPPLTGKRAAPETAAPPDASTGGVTEH
ncbi:hypothetical protein LBMAG45_01660 [Nitrospirota bacterium]|nr:hypothetical protein LBMAG45_01660 [Nitrospirota bacterium]